MIEILISVLFEVPGLLVCAYLIEKSWSGRKNSLTYSYLGASTSLMVLFLLKGKCNNIILISIFLGFTVLLGLSKYFTIIAFQIIYLFTSEIYDTAIRVTACGLYNTVCRLHIDFVMNNFYLDLEDF